MKIRFDADQQYQLDAVQAVLDIFDGQPLAESQRTMRLNAPAGDLFSELFIANRLLLNDVQLAANIKTIQEANEIKNGSFAGRHFSIEMETGTGKTYVYLRTIYELNERYGFTKFVIVVPSVAIREGVMKSVEMTEDHFQDIYGNKPINVWTYDSKQVSKLRDFSSKNTLQVLVINIDAFNKKDIAVIHKEQDRMSGRRPIEFIQAVAPIVIMDEPQNMESDKAKEAIESLNPLCTLRYSATHRDVYNLIYRLDPVKAYDLGLVKRIEVDSVLEQGDFNQPYILLHKTNATKSKITAQISIDIQTNKGTERKKKTIKHGEDLEALTGRAHYSGYVVSEIHHGDGYIDFSNGHRIYVGESVGGQTDELMQVQIEETIKSHFDNELRLKHLMSGDEQIKVLSLFFIDKVANYVDKKGKIRKWFIDAYKEIKNLPKYSGLKPLQVEQVHNGYFSQDKSGKAKDTRGDTQADDDAYELIMKDKERLLSPEEPLRFIFSHSALREGWDNPNVFQICTLNETRSEIKKRQEIGRGLRLPVMSSGLRCFDSNINRLTVIANESYEEFANKLQSEIEEDCGVKFKGRIKNKRQRKSVNLKKGWKLDEDFKELWERIKHKTRYRVEYDSNDLIKEAAKEINAIPTITAPQIVTTKVGIQINKEGVSTELHGIKEDDQAYEVKVIPDLLSFLQHETELTRHTLAEILIASGRLKDIAINPQQFLDESLKAIQRVLNKIMVDGVKYERIENQSYEMRLFEQQDLESYLDKLIKVDKSIYDYVEYDSDKEKEIAEALDKRTDIKLFVKLPGWFKVDTPVGTYNPDWAIVLECDNKLYLVRESKGTKDKDELRGKEWSKIQCGKAHFDELKVDFEHIASVNEIRCK